MKGLVAKMTLAAVLAAATAPAALAQSMRAQADGQPPRLAAPWSAQAPERAFAQNIRPDGRVYSSNPAYDVFDTKGEYAGSDPDPAVREQLQRDNPFDPNDND